MSSSGADVSLFGWDLTLNSVKNDINSKEDMLAVIIHWCLTRSGFRCVGVGESMEPCESDSPSEMLPEGWNFTDNYALRYVRDNKLYNVAINKSGSDIVFVNIIHKGQNFALDVKLNDVIKNLSGSMTQIVPNYKEFLQRVETNLIESLVDEKCASGSRNADVKERSSCSSLPSNILAQPRRGIPAPQFDPQPLYPRPPQQPWLDPLADPRQVGRADLDPFHQGGGMLFAPPPDRPGVARGSVPPGGRFDPFLPEGLNPDPTGQRRPPGTDHLPPPGYDDMFM